MLVYSQKTNVHVGLFHKSIKCLSKNLFNCIGTLKMKKKIKIKLSVCIKILRHIAIKYTYGLVVEQWHMLLAAFLSLLCFAQCMHMYYHPYHQMPTREQNADCLFKNIKYHFIQCMIHFQIT